MDDEEIYKYIEFCIFNRCNRNRKNYYSQLDIRLNEIRG